MRRGLVVLLAVPVLLALTGALGQSTQTLTAVAPAATLQVELPDVLRGGLMWRARIVVRAARTIEFPRIVLGPGFVHGMQLNTLEPAPASEASRGQHVVLSYDELAAGDELVVYLQLQVDPTTVGDAGHERRARRRGAAARARGPHDEGAAVMDLVLRAVVVFFAIFLVTRAVGRRELSTMEPFDLILLIVTGDLMQQAITQSDYSLSGGLTVLATIALLTVALSYVSFKVPKLRPVLDGEPLVLVQDGEVIERNLRRERITIDELLAEARQQQIGSLEQVRFAVLETNGKISIIPA